MCHDSSVEKLTGNFCFYPYHTELILWSVDYLYLFITTLKKTFSLKWTNSAMWEVHIHFALCNLFLQFDYNLKIVQIFLCCLVQFALSN